MDVTDLLAFLNLQLAPMKAGTKSVRVEQMKSPAAPCSSNIIISGLRNHDSFPCRELDSLRARNRALTQQAIDLQRTGPSQAAPLPVSFPSSAAASQEAARNAAAVQEAERRASQADAEASSLRQQLQQRTGERHCRSPYI